jgi:hypothetical protein
MCWLYNTESAYTKYAQVGKSQFPVTKLLLLNYIMHTVIPQTDSKICYWVLQNDYPILAESKQAHAPHSQDNIMFVMYLNDGNIKYTYIQRLLLLKSAITF